MLLDFKPLLPFLDLCLITPFFAIFLVALIAAARAELWVSFCLVISDFLPVSAFDGLPVLPELMIGIPQCFAGAIGAKPIQRFLFPIQCDIAYARGNIIHLIFPGKYGLIFSVQSGQFIGCGSVNGILFE